MDAVHSLNAQVSKGKQVLADTSDLAIESTPLISAIQDNPNKVILEVARIDPKQLAEESGKNLAIWLTSPLQAYLPDVERYADDTGSNQSTLVTVIIEACVLGKYAAPIFFTLVQEHSVVIAPTVSLGHLSTTALAASTISLLAANVTGYSILQGLTSALDTHIASNTTDPRLASIWCQRTSLIASLALIPILKIWFHAESILLAMKQDPEVAQLAGSFLKFTAMGLPAYIFNEIMKRYLSSRGQSGLTTSIITAIVPINILMNYILVDGPTSCSLGFIGAPVSMALSYNLIALLTIFAVGVRAPRVDDASSTTAADLISRPPFLGSMWSLVCAGLAGVGRTASRLWSKDLIGLAASILGPRALATQAVLLAVATTVHQVPRALNDTSSIRIKKLLGKGDLVRAKIATVVALLATLLAVVILSNVLLVSSESLGRLFNDDPVVIQDVMTVIPFIALFQACHGLGAWVDGTLSALGKSGTFPVINASADYFSGIPLGLYLAFGRSWGLSGIWAGLTASLAYSFLAGTVVIVRLRWSDAIPAVLAVT